MSFQVHRLLHTIKFCTVTFMLEHKTLLTLSMIFAISKYRAIKIRLFTIEILLHNTETLDAYLYCHPMILLEDDLALLKYYSSAEDCSVVYSYVLLPDNDYFSEHVQTSSRKLKEELHYSNIKAEWSPVTEFYNKFS